MAEKLDMTERDIRNFCYKEKISYLPSKNKGGRPNGSRDTYKRTRTKTGGRNLKLLDNEFSARMDKLLEPEEQILQK